MSASFGDRRLSDNVEHMFDIPFPPELQEHPLRRGLNRFVLPDPYDRPTCCSKCRIGSPVAVDVRLQLWRPVPGVPCGVATMLGATVPETAIHEDGETGSSK